MRQFSTTYIFLFAAALCLACSAVVSVAAVSLKARQETNKTFDRKRSVLEAARLIKPGGEITPRIVDEEFENIRIQVLDLQSKEYVERPEDWDPDAVPDYEPMTNTAGIKDVPELVEVFEVLEEGKVDMLVLPVKGKGLWSTLYGYLALDSDTRTIEGLTYYAHGETPGLGGEVDNPRWKALWPGRQAYDEDWNVAIEVIKGSAGPPSEAPHKVDGLSGATITSRGVTNMMEFWLGEQGYGPFLEKFRKGELAS